MHVKTRQTSSVQGHGFPHPVLALMLLFKVWFIFWQPPDTEETLEERNFFVMFPYCVPSDIYILDSTTSLQRGSDCRFPDGKTET